MSTADQTNMRTRGFDEKATPAVTGTSHSHGSGEPKKKSLTKRIKDRLHIGGHRKTDDLSSSDEEEDARPSQGTPGITTGTAGMVPATAAAGGVTSSANKGTHDITGSHGLPGAGGPTSTDSVRSATAPKHTEGVVSSAGAKPTTLPHTPGELHDRSSIATPAEHHQHNTRAAAGAKQTNREAVNIGKEVGGAMGPEMEGAQRGTAGTAQQGMTGATTGAGLATAGLGGSGTTSTTRDAGKHTNRDAVTIGKEVGAAMGPKMEGAQRGTAQQGVTGAPRRHFEDTRENTSTMEYERSRESGVQHFAPMEAAVRDATDRWEVAQAETRKAEEEAVAAERASHIAYSKAKEAERLHTEALQAHKEYDTTQQQLRQVETQVKTVNVGEKAREYDAAQTAVAVKTNEIAQLKKEADAAALAAQQAYEQAVHAQRVAQTKRATVMELEQQLNAARANMRELEERNRGLSESAQAEAERLQQVKQGLSERQGNISSLEREAEMKEREAAETRQRAEAERERLASHQSSVAAAEERARARAAEAAEHDRALEASRLQIEELEGKLAAATSEAERVDLRQKAELARGERERALDRRRELEAAAKGLDSAQVLAADRKAVLTEAQREAEAQRARAAPLQSELQAQAATANQMYKKVEDVQSEWSEAKTEAELHKGKWHEHWEAAKVAGDEGDHKVSSTYEMLKQTIGGVMPQGIKNVLGARGGEGEEGIHYSDAAYSGSKNTDTATTENKTLLGRALEFVPGFGGAAAGTHPATAEEQRTTHDSSRDAQSGNTANAEVVNSQGTPATRTDGTEYHTSAATTPAVPTNMKQAAAADTRGVNAGVTEE